MASFMSASLQRSIASSGVSGSTVSVPSVTSPSCSSRIRFSPPLLEPFERRHENRLGLHQRVFSRQPVSNARMAVLFSGARRSTYDVVIRFPASSMAKPSLIQRNLLSSAFSSTLTEATRRQSVRRDAAKPEIPARVSPGSVRKPLHSSDNTCVCLKNVSYFGHGTLSARHRPPAPATNPNGSQSG